MSMPNRNAELLTRRTTLDEYIAATHQLVANHFAVETDKGLTSKGPITNPYNKLCPKNLRPWPDFLEQQRPTLGALYGTFPRIAKRPISCEKTLEYFLHNTVEDPVREIFENHPNVISDVAEERKNQGRIRPDQICVYRFDDELSTRRIMLYVSEYKAPHKLAAPHLRVGLHPMDIFKDVVNRKTIPTAADPEGRFQYHAERLTAAAITQTYNYMIEGDWQEPGTLLYHLAEPAFEVAAQSWEHHACTAVGQYLAFNLLALGPPGNPPTVRSQDERQRVILGLRRWPEDFETTLRSVPRDERYAPSGSSSGSLKRTVQMCSQDAGAGTTSLRRMSPRLRCRTPRHRLLLGLVRRGRLDAKCPNVLLHRQANLAAADHLIDRDEFLRRLDEGGSRGVLFKMSLMADSYTFVAKGTVSAFIRDVSVCLGAIDLRDMGRIYYYDHRVYIEYLLLLSMAVKRCLRAIHRACVVHQDVRRNNVLRNTDTGELMLIDFERSVVKAGRKPLGNIVPNKRSWNGQRKETTASMYSHGPGDAKYEEDIL
ncbi:hypothetical protein BKA67DRAFT_639738 [Truncatella angustata]|uniref:Protein kinase domain-containing protein n=1 Tax=Truncatella angustata TaxID=152316 RepID=A0A9P8RGY6_9PEZI|nr:uncharacterized protein BKA67DRAFT_639738 [Truncatella angustata]KAH6645642.1 hypothetical protein BKA67DRAFT_639738 [Truncatella angustata]